MLTRAAILALCALSGAASADVAVGVTARPAVLSLRTGDVAVNTLPDLLNSRAFPADAALVMVLKQPMTEDARVTLDGAGVVVLDYLPTNAYFVNVSKTTPAALRTTGLVASIHRVPAEWKLDALLRKGAAVPVWTTGPFQQAAAKGEAAMALTLWRGVRPDATLAWLKAQPGVTVRAGEAYAGASVIHVTGPRTLAEACAARADVQYVELVPEFTERSNATTRWVVQSNISGLESVTSRGIIGAGAIIGHIDSGLAWDHCALRDAVNPIGPLHRKIVAFNAPMNYSGHGIHTAGTLLGDDGTAGANRGVAWGARMVHNNYPSYTETAMYGRFELHRTQGAFVHSNSWGSDVFHSYEIMCRAVDAFHHDHEDNLLVFAISDQLILGIPDSAKNALMVSASNNAPTQDAMCVLLNGGPAAGPTADGRRRPDIVAPGCNIVSSLGQTGCGLGTNSGTSMACPAAAGIATLTREYFTRGFYPSGAETPSDAFVPTGALLRAMLVNSANDLGAEAGYPGNKEGWGRILAEDSLYFAGDNRRTALLDLANAHPDALQTGGSRSMAVQVFNPSTLKVTLTWTDRPAAANASFAPVNDLDLVVTSPGGQVYRGNVFAGGVSVPGGSPDTLNNTEQVHITTPASGTWTIEVQGSQVNLGPQGFAIVATGGLTQVTCDDIDFNNDGLFPDTLDIEDFLSVFSGGPCSNDPNCSDIDFNNDGLFPDTADIEALLRVFGGGGC